MEHIEIVKKWFDEIDLQKYFPGQKSFDDNVALAKQHNCFIFTEGYWHSGEGYCDDTWEESLVVKTPFGEHSVMTIPVEHINHINYEIRTMSKWYQPEKYKDTYMSRKKTEFLQFLAEAKFNGYRFVGDELKFRTLLKVNIWSCPGYSVSNRTIF